MTRGSDERAGQEVNRERRIGPRDPQFHVREAQRDFTEGLYERVKPLLVIFARRTGLHGPFLGHLVLSLRPAENGRHRRRCRQEANSSGIVRECRTKCFGYVIR